MLSKYVALLMNLLLDPFYVKDLIGARGHLVHHVKVDCADRLKGQLSLPCHKVRVSGCQGLQTLCCWLQVLHQTLTCLASGSFGKLLQGLDGSVNH